MSPRPMRRYRPDTIDRAQQAFRVSERLRELHERGPIGRLEAHRAMHEVGIIRCPVCEVAPSNFGGSE